MEMPVEVDISYHTTPICRTKVWVFKSVADLIKTVDHHGGSDFLEKEKIFVFLFQFKNSVEDVEDYNEVLNKYPHSSRVCGCGIYHPPFKREEDERAYMLNILQNIPFENFEVTLYGE